MNHDALFSAHTCHDQCPRPACVATREAVRAERERILAILDDMQANCEHHTFYGYAANVIRSESPK